MLMKDQSICCPEFNPQNWDNKTHIWENKKFIKDTICTFFYMPLNFGSVMKRLDKIVTFANADIPDYLCLSEHISKWKMNVYLAVDKEIDTAENIQISGKFFSKVYEGAFNKTGEWCADFEQTAKAQNMTIKKMYMWYTTCPKCAKKYGKNYVVIISQIE
jgi:hypothetical protein